MLPENALSFLVNASLASLGHADDVWEPDIIIIGAGIAGLSAARHLKLKGYKVLVLEARDRIGGRIWSKSVGETIVDFGASWIHGTTDNPISKIVEEHDITTACTDYSCNTMYFQGNKLTDDEKGAVQEQFLLWKSFQNEAQLTGGPDMSLGDVVRMYAEQNNLGAEDLLKLQFAVNTFVEQEYGGSAESLSLLHWDQDGGVNGPDVIFPRGYSQVVDAVAEGLAIHLNQPVKSIVYSDEGVAITTASGRTFKAKAAVVTLPLGVLKNGTVDFQPPLPPSKQQSISALGMGLLQKIVLVFEKKFWDDSVMLHRIPEAGHHGEFSEYLNIHRFFNEPILMCFNGADYAWENEKRTDEEIVAAAMKCLRQMYGQNVADPKETHVSRWGSDPFSMGAYSYIPVGASGVDYDTMAAPVGKSLHFAGEATHRLHPQTVHGAFLSGQVAANAVTAAGIKPSNHSRKDLPEKTNTAEKTIVAARDPRRGMHIGLL